MESWSNVKPFFSIIIPAKNEEIELPILLKSLSLQTDKDFEIIVSDDDSIDDTKKIATSFQKKINNLKIISHNSSNVATGRNIGAKQALGNFLIFMDSDVEVLPDFIASIKKNIIQKNMKLLSLLYRPKNSSWKGKLCLQIYNFFLNLSKNTSPLCGGACIILEKKIFESLGGYDEKIIFGEDSDLVRRAFKKTLKFYVLPKPFLYVSTRRYEKEGIILTMNKIVKSNFYMFFIGPIKKPLFNYEMGGQYFKRPPINKLEK
jgi:glycosyltransferase involved in cell wall biosynthesis